MILCLLGVALALETLGPLPSARYTLSLSFPLKGPRSFLYSFRILGQFANLTYCCRDVLKKLKDQVPFDQNCLLTATGNMVISIADYYLNFIPSPVIDDGKENYGVYTLCAIYFTLFYFSKNAYSSNLHFPG